MCNTKKETEGDTEYITAEEIQLTGEQRRDKDIQRAKLWLNRQNIPKSGYNKHHKYNYYKYEDFIGYVQLACEKFDLTTHFTMGELLPDVVERPRVKRNEPDMMPTRTGMARLEVKSLHYHEPRVTTVPYSFMLEHSDTGKSVTYTKRYAYMNAFELSEEELVEIENVPDKPASNTNQSNNTGGNGRYYSKNSGRPQSSDTQKVIKDDTTRATTDDTKVDTPVETTVATTDDTSWQEDEIIKSLHKKMRKRNPKAYLDKKTTRNYAKMEYTDGNLTEQDYQEVQKLLKDTTN